MKEAIRQQQLPHTLSLYMHTLASVCPAAVAVVAAETAAATAAAAACFGRREGGREGGSGGWK